MINDGLLLIAGAILSVVGPMLASYITEKGKNQATKEDIRGITELVESVKHENSEHLEQLKSALVHRINRNKFRYEKEFEILSALAAKTVNLRDATTLLRPSVDVSTGLPEDEQKKLRYGRWQEAEREFYNATEWSSPFYPEEIFQQVKELEKVCLMESNRYRTYSSNPEHRHYDPKYWEESSENAAKIRAQTESVLAAIRSRVKKWEDD